MPKLTHYESHRRRIAKLSESAGRPKPEKQNRLWTANGFAEETGFNRNTVADLLDGVTPQKIRGKRKFYRLRDLIEGIRRKRPRWTPIHYYYARKSKKLQLETYELVNQSPNSEGTPK